jgi:UDP-N-acetylmuramate--alanine ligase
MKKPSWILSQGDILWLSAQADYRAVNRRFTPAGTVFEVVYQKHILGKIELCVPGDYNVKNAMAAVAVSMELGIPFRRIARAMKQFKSLRRRFEIKKIKKGIMVVDDYAHHPTEITASLQGAKDTYDRNIIAIFQPHLYSRTKDFCDAFGQSFFNADLLIVTDIYPAREKPVKGVTGKLIADAAVKFGHHRVKYFKDKGRVVKYVINRAKKGDMILTMGAGDIWKIGERIIREL